VRQKAGFCLLNF